MRRFFGALFDHTITNPYARNAEIVARAFELIGRTCYIAVFLIAKIYTIVLAIALHSTGYASSVCTPMSI